MNDQTQPIPAASNPEPVPGDAVRETNPKRWKGRVPLVATAAAGLAVGALVASAVFAATGPDASPGVSTVASSSTLGQRTDGGGGSDVPAVPAAPDSGDGATVPAVPTPPGSADGATPAAPGDEATPPTPPAGGPGTGGPGRVDKVRVVRARVDRAQVALVVLCVHRLTARRRLHRRLRLMVRLRLPAPADGATPPTPPAAPSGS
ncbi:MAG: hypothetical protein U5N21_24395 [Rhodococcus sp. (in: high G+C Gram-positive bacteria)]|nr:hypothetical protein [Rhodococcus sp. (in: high G+C Gram-positive bacteria)]